MAQDDEIRKQTLERLAVDAERSAYAAEVLERTAKPVEGVDAATLRRTADRLVSQAGLSDAAVKGIRLSFVEQWTAAMEQDLAGHAAVSAVARADLADRGRNAPGPDERARADEQVRESADKIAILGRARQAAEVERAKLRRK